MNISDNIYYTLLEMGNSNESFDKSSRKLNNNCINY